MEIPTTDQIHLVESGNKNEHVSVLTLDDVEMLNLEPDHYYPMYKYI